MMRDRLATVLRVRELVERQRLAERAAALRVAEVAREEHAAARDARSQAAPAAGETTSPTTLVVSRLGELALHEAVVRADGDRRDAERRVTSAEAAWTSAAIERRSAERLRDRRAAALAAEEQRHASRRADDVALQQWRSRS